MIQVLLKMHTDLIEVLKLALTPVTESLLNLPKLRNVCLSARNETTDVFTKLKQRLYIRSQPSIPIALAFSSSDARSRRNPTDILPTWTYAALPEAVTNSSHAVKAVRSSSNSLARAEHESLPHTHEVYTADTPGCSYQSPTTSSCWSNIEPIDTTTGLRKVLASVEESPIIISQRTGERISCGTDILTKKLFSHAAFDTENTMDRSNSCRSSSAALLENARELSVYRRPERTLATGYTQCNSSSDELRAVGYYSTVAELGRRSNNACSEIESPHSRSSTAAVCSPDTQHISKSSVQPSFQSRTGVAPESDRNVHNQPHRRIQVDDWAEASLQTVSNKSLEPSGRFELPDTSSSMGRVTSIRDPREPQGHRSVRTHERMQELNRGINAGDFVDGPFHNASLTNIIVSAANIRGAEAESSQYCHSALHLQQAPFLPMLDSIRPDMDCSKCSRAIPSQPFQLVIGGTFWQSTCRFLVASHLAPTPITTSTRVLFGCRICTQGSIGFKHIHAYKGRNELWAHLESHSEQELIEFVEHQA